MKSNCTFVSILAMMIGCTLTKAVSAQKVKLSSIEVSAAAGTAEKKSYLLNGGLDLYEVNNWAIGGNILLYTYSSPNQPTDYRPSYNLLSNGRSSYSDEMFTFSLNITKRIPVCKYFKVGISIGIAETQINTFSFKPNPDSRGGWFAGPSNYIDESKRSYCLGYLAQTKFIVPINKHSALSFVLLSNQNPKNSYNGFTFSYDRLFNIKGVFSKKK